MEVFPEKERRAILDPLYLSFEKQYADMWTEMTDFHQLVMMCQDRIGNELDIDLGYELDAEIFFGYVSTQLKEDMEVWEMIGYSHIYDHSDTERTTGKPLPAQEQFSATAIMPTLDVSEEILQSVPHVSLFEKVEDINRERARAYSKREDVCGASGADIARHIDEAVATYDL